MATISGIASSGMRAAQQRLDSSAHNIANLQTAEFRRQTTNQQTEPAQGGVRASNAPAKTPGNALETDMVGQIAATYDFAANLQAFKRQDQMLGALLDEKA